MVDGNKNIIVSLFKVSIVYVYKIKNWIIKFIKALWEIEKRKLKSRKL